MNFKTVGAADEFRPLMYPFTTNTSGITQDALKGLVEKVASVIFAEVSASYGSNPISVVPLTAFLKKLQDDYITRIYTTNYDDFPIQALPVSQNIGSPVRGSQ